MENQDVHPEAHDESGLLNEWLSRADLAEELGLSADTLQRWETRRIGPVCVRVGRKALYRKDAVRDWLRDQESRKQAARAAVSGRR
jgi:hypothetical protein